MTKINLAGRNIRKIALILIVLIVGFSYASYRTLLNMKMSAASFSIPAPIATYLIPTWTAIVCRQIDLDNPKVFH